MIDNKIKFNIPENIQKRCSILSKHTKMCSVRLLEHIFRHFRQCLEVFGKLSEMFGNSSNDQDKNLTHMTKKNLVGITWFLYLEVIKWQISASRFLNH